MSRLIASAAIAALLAAAAAAPSFAQEAQSRVVSYADLDLYDPADADEFIARIQNASDEVCGDHPGRRTIAETRDVRDCSAETTDYAIEDFGHPMVTGRYHGFTPNIVVEGSWDGDGAPYYEVKPKS